MKKLLLAGVCFTAWVGSAVAADMAVKTKAPAYTPPYSWTGCYGGFNFGSLFEKDVWSGTAAGTSYGTTDLLVGGQIGCNYQFGTWVVGIQGDYDWTNATGTGADLVSTALTDQTHVSSYASVTGRLGYAMDRWLPYFKGGGAWTHDAYSTFFTVPNTAFSSGSATRSGWTIGGGLEYAIVSNLSIFIEYDYAAFGTSTFTFAAPVPSPSTSIRETDSIVKVGLNWKVFPW
jgi:outer membrane immunogenic protein